jgi:hypothetical protein
MIGIQMRPSKLIIFQKMGNSAIIQGYAAARAI